MEMNWKLKYGLVALALGIIMLVMSLPKAISFLGDPVKIDTVEKAKNLKPGDHVTIDITMSDGYYMTYLEDNKEVARYYIATFLNLDNFTDYGLTVRVNKQYYSNMEDAKKACDQFFEDWYDDPSTPLPSKVFLQIDGVIEEFANDKEKEYAKDYVDSGYLDYVYVVPNSKNSTFIFVIIGGVITAVGILLIVLFFLGRKKDKARLEEMRANNPTYYQAPAGVTFNNNVNDPNGHNPYVFDPNTDPRFNGMAQGNPVAPNNQYNAQHMNGNFNEVAPTNGQYSAPADNSGNFNEIPNNDPFNNQQ